MELKHSYNLSFFVCLPLPYFSKLSHKQHYFWENLLKLKRVLVFSTTFVSNVSHSKKTRMILWSVYIGLHVKYLLLLSDSNKTCIFRQTFENFSYTKISLKCVQWERSCFICTDGRTQKGDEFLISNFHRVLDVLFFLLGGFLASEFHMPTFRKIQAPRNRPNDDDASSHSS
jgi:hypothetical protein